MPPSVGTLGVDDDVLWFAMEYVRGVNLKELLMRGEALNNFKSVECQIMDWADDAAYSLNDIVDGVKAGFPESWRATCTGCHDKSNSPGFDFERDLERIENEMRRIAKKAGAIVCSEYTRAEAHARLAQAEAAGGVRLVVLPQPLRRVADVALQHAAQRRPAGVLGAGGRHDVAGVQRPGVRHAVRDRHFEAFVAHAAISRIRQRAPQSSLMFFLRINSP